MTEKDPTSSDPPPGSTEERPGAAADPIEGPEAERFEAEGFDASESPGEPTEGAEPAEDAEPGAPPAPSGLARLQRAARARLAALRRLPPRRWAVIAVVGGLWVALLTVVALRGPLSERHPESPEAPSGSEPIAPQGDRALTVVVRDADGHPMEGATVAYTSRTDPPQVASARTGTRGRVVLEGLPEGLGRLLVERSGYARHHPVTRIGPEDATLEVVLEAGAGLDGRVLDEEADPVGGASIRVWPAGDDAVPPWEGHTDEDGRFSFDTLRTGDQRIEVSAAGHATAHRSVGGDTEDLRIILERTGEIAGRVTGPDGPVEAARVVLAGSGIWPPRQTDTDAEGGFRITGIPGGVYEVRASKGALVAEPREGLTLVAGGSLQLHLRLGPGATLRGEVRSAEDGTAIQGAEVVVTEDALTFAPKAVRTDGQGRFAVAGLRRQPHRVSIHAEGFVPVTGATHDPAEPATFELRRAAILAGQVVDALDRPVEGVRIEVIGTGDDGTPITLRGGDVAFREALFQSQLEGPLPIEPSGELGVTFGEVPPLPLGTATAAPLPASEPRGHDPGQTDAEGRFRLEGVPPGELQLVARHPDHPPVTNAPLLVTAGSIREDLLLRLPDGGRIEGRVVDGRGFPVGHVRVELQGEGEPFPRMVLAAEDGTFTFEEALGTATLTAYPSGRPAARKTLPVLAGETLEVELALEGELTALAVRTVDGRGFPVGGARVHVRSLHSSTPAERTAWSEDDGTLEIGGLPPPPWRIEVSHEDYSQARIDRDTEPDGELRIPLEPSASIRGQVVSRWDGEPVEGVRVRLESAPGAPHNTRSDASGQFEFSRLPAGNYELILTHDEHLEVRRGVSLRENARGLEDVTVPPIELAAGGSVSGEVVDALGAPVSGAEVTFDGDADWAQATRTDARGRFTLEGLAPGEVRLAARHPAAGELREAYPVAVRRAENTPGVRLRLPDRFDADDAELGEGQQHGVAVAVADREGEVRVTSVVRGSRAARAGIRAGDVLLEVDEERVLTAGQARGMLRGPAGIEAILRIRRGERTARIPVLREGYTP